MAVVAGEAVEEAEEDHLHGTGATEIMTGHAHLETGMMVAHTEPTPRDTSVDVTPDQGPGRHLGHVQRAGDTALARDRGLHLRAGAITTHTLSRQSISSQNI